MVPARRKLPKHWRKSGCPDCGSTMKFAERIYSFRSVKGWTRGTLLIDCDIENSLEASDDNHLYCPKCLSEWILPTSASFV